MSTSRLIICRRCGIISTNNISALGDDYYKFDRETHSITGFQAGNAYRLGDIVRVAVANVDVEARELDFRVLGHIARSQAPTSGGKSGGKDKKKTKRSDKSKGKGKGKKRRR